MQSIVLVAVVTEYTKVIAVIVWPNSNGEHWHTWKVTTSSETLSCQEDFNCFNSSQVTCRKCLISCLFNIISWFFCHHHHDYLRDTYSPTADRWDGCLHSEFYSWPCKWKEQLVYIQLDLFPVTSKTLRCQTMVPWGNQCPHDSTEINVNYLMLELQQSWLGCLPPASEGLTCFDDCSTWTQLCLCLHTELSSLECHLALRMEENSETFT